MSKLLSKTRLACVCFSLSFTAFATEPLDPYLSENTALIQPSMSQLDNGKNSEMPVSQPPNNEFDMTLNAAEAGLVHAQVQLAIMYEQGLGTEIDLEEAAFWYRLAANQGHLEAQYNLALLYINGEGVEEDSSAALYWIERAAHQGYMPAIIHLSIYSEFNEVAYNIWIQKAAEAGDLSARMLLVEYYLSTSLTNENLTKAEYWLWSAAKQGVLEAQIKLHEFYSNPKYGREDEDKSRYWLQQANQGQDEELLKQ
ncbi:sel1 repeat family protein [Vibrio sp. T187]|uniref:tetratricopeptide repeat protein n=1 Tax=Vibrio TaxID=662 RepID=UPI0010CA0603|nr:MULTISPECIES: tetratricopeptide repeat protein [Vibrio]MBW3697740.1 sel1 repeat family protein [Vibrio sp. T187]